MIETVKSPIVSRVLFLILSVIALFGATVNAQSNDWKIVPVSREERNLYQAKGAQIIKEQHPDGRRRTTTIEYFPGTRTVKSESVTTLDGPLTTFSSRSWNFQRDQIAYTEQMFNKDGKLFGGTKWYFPVDGGGKIVGPRIDEKYDPETQGWMIEPEEATMTNPRKEAVQIEQITTIEWETGIDAFTHFSIQEVYTALCPPNPDKVFTRSALYGGPQYYHQSSAICPAAVHSGVISFASGGIVRFKVVDGTGKSSANVGSSRNGVISNDAQFEGSAVFSFVR